MSTCGSCYGDASGEDVRICPSHKCKKKICNECDPIVEKPITVKSVAAGVMGVLAAIEAIGLGGEALILADFIDIDDDETRVVCNGCLVKNTHKYFKDKNQDRWLISICLGLLAGAWTLIFLPDKIANILGSGLILFLIFWLLWSVCLYKISIKYYYPQNKDQWVEFRKSLIPLVVHRYGYERIFLFAQQKPPYKKQRRLSHGDAFGEDESEKRTFDDAHKEAMHQYIFNNFMSFQL